MDIHLWALIFGFPILVACLHELTHVGVARCFAKCTVSIHSYFPILRLEIQFTQKPPEYGVRAMALSPLLIGLIVGMLAYVSGLWQSVKLSTPYYVDTIVIANWVLYSHLSPADLKTAYNPYRRGDQIA